MLMNALRLVEGSGVGTFLFSVDKKGITIAGLQSTCAQVPIAELILFKRIFPAVLVNQKFDSLGQRSPHTSLSLSTPLGEINTYFSLIRIDFLHYLPQKLGFSVQQ